MKGNDLDRDSGERMLAIIVIGGGFTMSTKAESRKGRVFGHRHIVMMSGSTHPTRPGPPNGLLSFQDATKPPSFASFIARDGG